jgi:BolA family transcriptional regulator, general stress-responsive regulator
MADPATMERIRAALETALHPIAMDIEDESALHAGHEGAKSGGGHYRLRAVADCFAGRSRVERHRLVYDALRELMRRDIHALAMTLLAPQEVDAARPSTGQRSPRM